MKVEMIATAQLSCSLMPSRNFMGWAGIAGQERPGEVSSAHLGDTNGATTGA